jgi:hypothetical protein
MAHSLTVQESRVPSIGGHRGKTRQISRKSVRRWGIEQMENSGENSEVRPEVPARQLVPAQLIDWHIACSLVRQ